MTAKPHKPTARKTRQQTGRQTEGSRQSPDTMRDTMSDTMLMNAHLAAIRQSGLVSQEMIAQLTMELEQAVGPTEIEQPDQAFASELSKADFLPLLTPSSKAAPSPQPESTPEQLEIDCARRFNFPLPEDPIMAVEALESTVLALTGATRCELFSFDEASGIYTSLSDEKKLGAKPRELTWISDDFLQTWLAPDRPASEQSEDPQPTIATIVQHAHLSVNGTLVGLVAIANPDAAFGTDVLERLSPYLSVKVVEFKALKKTLLLPYQQDILIDMSTRLVSAVDKEGIVTETMDLFWARMGFGACQFVVFNEANGEGTVLYENINGKLKSFFHAGLVSKRHVVKDFASLVSLLSSGWRKMPYLHLTGRQLGDKPLSSIFGVKHVYSALILPVFDVQTGKILGTLNLFQTKPIEISAQTIEILVTVVDLVANALGRATVLEKALEMATMDELTSLLNRRGFYERFTAEVERARRHPTELCIALLDVDFFKKMNDTHGHLNGDRVLRALGSVLAGSVRKSDIVCRFGGEEFAVLLPDTPLQAGVDLMERIRRQVEALEIPGVQGETLRMTISIGVAAVPPVATGTELVVNQHREIVSNALAEADTALYAAKDSGRNRVCKAV